MTLDRGPRDGRARTHRCLRAVLDRDPDHLDAAGVSAYTTRLEF